MRVKWEIEFTDEFGEWWNDLDEALQDEIDRVVGMLEDRGPTLDFPYTSDVGTSAYGNMREMRIQHLGRPIRVFYAFDPRRAAIVLIGGDKTGLSDKRFYGQFVPIADNLYAAHLKELEEEGLI